METKLVDILRENVKNYNDNHLKNIDDTIDIVNTKIKDLSINGYEEFYILFNNTKFVDSSLSYTIQCVNRPIRKQISSKLKDYYMSQGCEVEEDYYLVDDLKISWRVK